MESADAVTVTAASSSDHVFKVTADYVNISGFTATGATIAYPAFANGICLTGADNCNISENNCSNNYGGIYLQSSSDNNITCNWVHNNTDAGFYLTSGSTGNTIESNNIIANGNYNDASGGWEWQFRNDQSDDVDTASNWWGTNNETRINASIYDWTYDTNRGNVTTNPKLDGTVPCAPIPELPTVLFLAVGLLMLVGYVRIRRKT